MKYKIRVCEPSIGLLERRYIEDVLKKGFISSTAPPVREFEEQFAKKFGVKNAVSVNSGGSALFVALWGLGIKKGDEIILPAFLHISAANAVKLCGAKPVFVDIEPDTYNINPDLISSKITPKTKAILVVHMYGHPCDMDRILKIVRKHKLYLVEDIAESHGALYKGKTTGSFGDIACASLYANKIITTGEGGMVLTNNYNLAEHVRKLKAHYFDTKVNKFLHQQLGFSFGMGSLQAALGFAQLSRLDELVNLRRANAIHYNKSLKNIVIIPVEKDYAKAVYWMYAIRVKNLATRNSLMDYLESKGIETRPFFISVNRQPVYKSNNLFPVSEISGDTGLYLPSGPELSKSDKDYVCSAVINFFKDNEE